MSSTSSTECISNHQVTRNVPAFGRIVPFGNLEGLVRGPSLGRELDMGGNLRQEGSDHGQQPSQTIKNAVQLPKTRSFRDKAKMSVIQSWAGFVESIEANTFLARVTDETDSTTPIELVEMSMAEISSSDKELVKPGAAFYWSIGYRDSSHGQRERVSVIRFVRKAKRTKASEDRLIREADAIAIFLESD